MVLNSARMELITFLQCATKHERKRLATTVCNGSVGYLYQLAGKHRYASPYMATQIEKVSRRMAARTRGRLAPVPRNSLVRHPEIFV